MDYANNDGEAMLVSIVVATCHRMEMFRNMLQSLVDTTQGYEIEIIAVIDEDFPSAIVAFQFDCHVVDFSHVRRGALACWNRGLLLSDGDIIVPAGDDQIFHPDWLKYALESHQNVLNGSGVVGMNDLAYDGNTQLATMILFDRQFCKEHLGGVIAPPVYNYYCVDSEINAKAKALGKFFWDNRAKVEHLHSAHNKRPVDMHDLDRQKKNYMEIDNRIFEERKAQNFPITWTPVI